MNINLHIDRVVLEGLNIQAHERSFVEASLKTELVRLFAAGGVSESVIAESTLGRISASGIRLTENNDASNLGEQIAQSIYGEIGK